MVLALGVQVESWCRAGGGVAGLGRVGLGRAGRQWGLGWAELGWGCGLGWGGGGLGWEEGPRVTRAALTSLPLGGGG